MGHRGVCRYHIWILSRAAIDCMCVFTARLFIFGTFACLRVGAHKLVVVLRGSRTAETRTQYTISIQACRGQRFRTCPPEKWELSTCVQIPTPTSTKSTVQKLNSLYYGLPPICWGSRPRALLARE